jgi:predicted RNA-binding protein YlxR (DUF448 family)
MAMAPPPRRRRATTDTAPLSEPGETDDDEPETGPLRRCVLTRERLAKEQMIRFVIGPDRTVVPDVAARLPGRGIWLSARGDVIETARAQGTLARVFARAARGTVALPPDLPALLQAQLARRIGDSLGLARRAGQAVCGFQKAREWLKSGRAGLILQASDGSADERARFMSGANEAGTGRHVPVLAPLPAAVLGAVFGRDHVVHVAVAPGRLADALVIETMRLFGLTGRADAQAGLQADTGLQAAGGNAGKNTPVSDRFE